MRNSSPTVNLFKTVIVTVLMCLACTFVHAQDASELAALQQRIEKLSINVDNAEAIKTVKRLQYAYSHYAEYGLWNDLADLFADDAVGYYPSGTVTGKENLRKLFLQDIGGGQIGLAHGRLYPHIMLSPVVTLDADGNTACGRWHVMAMLGTYSSDDKEGKASWAGGIYENVYVKDKGKWKIKEVHYYGQYSGPYQGGWHNIKEEKPEDVKPIPFHYDPGRAGTPTPTVDVADMPTGPAQDFNALATRFAKLERRTQVMDDKLQVQNLQHAYGFYVDRKMWDDVADLFADNGTMELDQRGVYVGKNSIRKSLEQFGPPGLRTGELNDHLQLQTVVSISPDGTKAYARGTEWQMIGNNGVGGKWGLGTFENLYVRDKSASGQSVWKIQSMHVYTRLLTDYDKGWAKNAEAPPVAAKNFAADKPPTEIYSAYPDFFIPSFHYSHPVTGRGPDYPPPAISTRAIVSPTEVPLLPLPKNAGELQARLAETERLLQVVSAADAVENISNAYGYYIDEFLWRDMADLFATNGWKELSYIGTYVGRERVYESVSRRYTTTGRRANSLAIHQKMQPVIHVAPDGQSTRIRTRLFQVNSSFSGDGSYIAGIYENQAIKENGVWKILGMDLDYTWTAPYTGGWAHLDASNNRRFASRAGGVADEFPPDRPLRGVTYAPYPDVAPMAFHYRNPVSKRKPAELLQPEME